MKIISLLILLSLGITRLSISQCPDKPGMPVLSTPEKVDSFLALYPNCTNYYEGYLNVNGKEILWLHEDVKGYLMALTGILASILMFLKLLFWKIDFFQNK